MADNTTLNVGTLGDSYRSIDKSGTKTQVVTLDLGGAGAEALTSGTVPVSGTITAVTAITNAIPAGDNNIGNVDVVTLPALAAGTNNIGDVDVLSDVITSSTTSAVTVAGTGLTTLATITNAQHKRLKFQCDVATQNCDDFEIQAKGHASALSMVITPTSYAVLPAGHYVTATGVHTTATGAYVDGDLNTIDSGQSGFFDMDIQGFTEIIVKVSASSDSASVTPRWTLS